jgi:pyrophosphatase PpaX
LKLLAYLIYFDKMMRKYQCIIFDVDGTLTQTNDLIFASFNHVSKKYTGQTFTPEQIISMFGPPEEIAIQKIVGDANIDAALKDFFDYYKSNHSLMARVFPGVEEVLAYLAGKGIILAIFTGKGRASTMITLKALEIDKYFDVIVTGTDVVNHKPSGEGINKILKYLGLKKHQVLMVGDAVSDVRAAGEAGIQMSAVLWDSYGKEQVRNMKVDFQFESVNDFFSFLRHTIEGIHS